MTSTTTEAGGTDPRPAHDSERRASPGTTLALACIGMGR
jgi:hypothetical protein